MDVKQQILERFKNTESGGGGELTSREKVLLNIAVDIIDKRSPTDERIAKAACEAQGIDWDEEEDYVDAVRIKIWCEGAKWLRDVYANG